MSRAPFKYEDGVAILRQVARPSNVDARQLAHAREMLFKLISQ